MKFIILAFLLTTLTCAAVAQTKPSSVKKKPAVAKKTPAKDVKPATPSESDLRKAYQAGDYVKALDLAERRLGYLPGDKVTMVVKALSYGMSRNKEMVVKTALTLYPRSPDTAAIFLATLPANFSKTVMKSDAAWYVQEAHKLSQSPIIYLMEASYLLDDSMFDKARTVALAGAATLTDKTDLAIQSQFANMLQGSGAKAEAFELINGLLKKHPEDTFVVAQYYAMLLADKRYTESLAELNHLMKLKGETKKLRKERAFLYEEMGRHADACVEAGKLNAEDDVYFGLLRKLNCPEAFADLTPANVKFYTYDVDYHGMKYQFIVRPGNVKMSEGVAFDWNMTIRADKSGSVKINKAALDTAHSQMNTFSSGPLTLDASTSVWVSNAVFKEIKNNRMSVISASEDGAKVFRIVEDDYDNELVVTVDEDKKKALKTLHVRSEDEKEELWINDDPTNPLITRMSIGWSIELVSID